MAIIDLPLTSHSVPEVLISCVTLPIPKHLGLAQLWACNVGVLAKGGGQGGEHKNEIQKPTPDYTLSAMGADGLANTTNTQAWGPGLVSHIQHGCPDERGGQGEVNDVKNQKLTGDCMLSAVCANDLGDVTEKWPCGPVELACMPR